MEIAPIQTYQGPALNPVGNFLEAKQASQQSALLQDEQNRKIQGREKMQGILSEMGDNIDYEKAAVQMLPVDPQMAGTLLQMANQSMQRESTSADIAAKRIAIAKEKIATETKLAKGAVDALAGVNEIGQKERIYDLYMQSIEKNGMEIPEELKGGYTPENEQNLRDLAEIGQSMIDLDPSKTTSDMKNFRYAKNNPEFADYLKQSNSRDITGTEAIVDAIRKENPDLTYTQALAISQGLARKGVDIKEGKAVPIEGVLESTTEITKAEETGKQQAQTASIVPKAREVERGAAFTVLDQMEANMPQVEAMIKDLSDLGMTATYSKTGRAEDFIQRELGADPGQDAEDRASYQSKISNEIIPLLRQTFGAQFTENEGVRLEKTLGNPDLHPREKDAILKSFIDQKRARIGSLKRQTGKTDAIDPSTLSDAELEAIINAAD